MAQIRCTRPFCRAVQSVADDRLGKNLHCRHCGCLMTAVPVAELEPERPRPASQVRRWPLTALLDNVRSLWNVGSMFRTADAAGFRCLHLTGITGQPPRKEIAKTALGAEELMPWTYSADAATAARRERDLGATLIALERTGRSVPYTELAQVLPAAALARSRPLCLIVGNEVAGVSGPLLELAPVHVHLPMLGAKESLNVAVAFGVMGFALADRFAAAGLRPDEFTVPPPVGAPTTADPTSDGRPDDPA